LTTEQLLLDREPDWDDEGEDLTEEDPDAGWDDEGDDWPDDVIATRPITDVPLTGSYL